MTHVEPGPSPTAHEPSWRLGLIWYVLSSAVVLVGVNSGARDMPGEPWFDYFGRWDGTHYSRICREGYQFDPTEPSSVAFFPIYPLLALPFMALGLKAGAALLLVSQLALAGCFVVLASYARERWPEASAAQRRAAILAFAFVPPTFYFRMAYSESLFVLCLLLMLLLMHRQGPLWAVALLAGAATGVRIVGVAVLPPFLFYIWRQSNGPKQFVLRAAWLTPLACFGLLGFMAYCAWAFGEPLAFIKNVQHWSVDEPGRSKALDLLTLRPFWRNFDPSSRCYFAGQDASGNPWTGLMMANPVWFAAAGLLLLWGQYRRHLNAYEGLLAAGLWFVPYVTRSHELCMGAAARYAAAIVPIYLLLGILFGRLSIWTGFAWLALASGMLALYSYKFSIWGAWFF